MHEFNIVNQLLHSYKALQMKPWVQGTSEWILSVVYYYQGPDIFITKKKHSSYTIYYET